VVAAVLMSIRPVYANAIFDGTKTVELRRRRPSFGPGTRVLVYTSSPTSALDGVFESGEVIELPLQDLWAAVSHRAGVDRETFDTYFLGCETGYAIEVTNARRVQRARLPFRPPQSYLFLRRDRTNHRTLLRRLAVS
jgi:predicted transcriptional regulator